MSGYIYCLSNPTMPGLLKIGMTERTPEERIKELATTGVPANFVIEIAKKVANVKEKEKIMHKLLEDSGYNPQREFFTISLEKVKPFFSLMDGEEWYECVAIEEPGRAQPKHLTEWSKFMNHVREITKQSPADVMKLCSALKKKKEMSQWTDEEIRTELTLIQLTH
jgi:hypothetical protein